MGFCTESIFLSQYSVHIMPVFKLVTNLTEDKVRQLETKSGVDLLEKLSKTMAACTGKPEKFVTVRIITGERMIFGGTRDPCAQAEFNCIGKISKDENLAHSQALFSVINEVLEIPVDRMYIKFDELQRENVGWNSRTFATLE